MTTTETTSYRIQDATSPLWLGRWPDGWGHVVHGVDSGQARTAAAMISTAGLAWTVEQHPLEAVLGKPDGDGESTRVPVPRVVANVRSDTRAVLGVVGEGYEPLQNGAAFAFCDGITDSGEAYWLGAGETRGGARVHALMQLDRTIRIGNAEGEDVLPLLCFRNGHDGGLAVTISVAPFRLACLNGMMLPLDGAARTWKARHTANLDARLTDARRTLGIAWRYYDELEQIGGRLISEPMSAWQELRPLLSSSDTHAAASEFGTPDISKLISVPAAALAAVGVQPDELSKILATVDAYDRANSRNLLAMTALLEAPPRLSRERQPVAQTKVSVAQPSSALLPMLDLGEVDSTVIALLEEMSIPITGLSRPIIIPSLWRHFAHRPALLGLLWTALREPLASMPGQADALIDDARRWSTGVYIANLHLDQPTTKTIERFRSSMARMVLCGRMIDAALAEGTTNCVSGLLSTEA